MGSETLPLSNVDFAVCSDQGLFGFLCSGELYDMETSIRFGHLSYACGYYSDRLCFSLMHKAATRSLLRHETKRKMHTYMQSVP
jgi:hypothetical protein